MEFQTNIMRLETRELEMIEELEKMRENIKVQKEKLDNNEV